MINHCQLDMIHLLFVVSIIILYNDHFSLFPTHNIKRGRLLMILFRGLYTKQINGGLYTKQINKKIKYNAS